MDNVEALEMEKEVYVAAMEGDVGFLGATRRDDLLLRKTPQKNNIIHIAIRREKLAFINATLLRFPHNKELITDKNSQENTPLHIAAEVGNSDIVRVMYAHLKEIHDDDDDVKPWLTTNLKGNTAAHEAIIHGHVKVAKFLLENDFRPALILNDSKEAALHLAIKNPVGYVQKKSTKAKIQHEINTEGAPTTKTTLVPGEDMFTITNLLVTKAGHVTCWPDANGITPLHRAASLTAPYNLNTIRFIIEQWPQSTEVCDKFGNTILHLLINKIPTYQEAKDLLNLKEIYDLRNCQDHQGNTPLHLAATNMDVHMVRALLESGTNLDVINQQGIDAPTIIRQQNMIEKLNTRKMTEEDCEAANRGDIDFLNERLRVLKADFLHSRDSNGQNILHKFLNIDGTEIVQEYFICDFIRKVLRRYPALVNQTDVNGDTPIHVLVRVNVKSQASRLSSLLSPLEVCKEFIDIMKEEAKTKGGFYKPPWSVQNAAGNTPLHEALLVNQIPGLINVLIRYDELSLRLRNKRLETPYHLLRGNSGCVEIMGHVDTEDNSSRKDLDGFTPVIRAIQGGWEPTAIELLKGKSGYKWFKGSDKKGNTPLHMAIQNRQFGVISMMLDLYLVHERASFLTNHLEVKNHAGETPAYLIGEMENVPSSLEQKILRNPHLRGIRSSWSIPKSQLQNYMGSVNVIAALLTTITFTAAFTVPGGLDQEKGTPLLMGAIAFQVFMVSNVIAMCLSMMVLFCLLWIVATEKRKSVMIQDFAVTLLLASFIATLLTFMAGVYATVYSVKPQIAIATLILCSLLMLLVHRFILTNLVLPLKNAIVLILFHPVYTVKLMLDKVNGKLL